MPATADKAMIERRGEGSQTARVGCRLRTGQASQVGDASTLPQGLAIEAKPRIRLRSVGGQQDPPVVIDGGLRFSKPPRVLWGTEVVRVLSAKHWLAALSTRWGR